MRIIHKDLKNGIVKIRLENLDDLWHLNNVIEAKDIVFGVTYRRDEKAADKIRAEKVEKRRMWLGVEVEKVEFHEFSDRLRVHGIIREGPQDLGQYHTINYEVGDEVEIRKGDGKSWKSYQIEELEDAEKASNQPIVTMLAIEDGEATFAILRQYGVQYIADISTQLSGKMYPSKDIRSEFYSEVLSKLMQIRGPNSPLIILGPGFAKEEFAKFAREREPLFFKNVKIESTGQAGRVGIQEGIKKGVVSSVVEGSRVEYETRLVERLLAEIGKGKLATYGKNEVKKALEIGAVDTLLVTDKMLRMQTCAELLDIAKSMNAKVAIISTANEAGEKLESLGGIAAILRYKIEDA